ncbi:MAG: hypothetical protein QXN59_01100 [Candidatus Micrarchaeaceae archaeon]
MKKAQAVAGYAVAVVVIAAAYLYAVHAANAPQPSIQYKYNASRNAIYGNITDTLGYEISFNEFYCKLTNGTTGLFPIGNNITLNYSQKVPFIITPSKKLTSNCTSVGVNYHKV